MKGQFKRLVKQLPDPYPASMNNTIKNDNDYSRLIPDPKTRTAVSWYLMGEAFRKTIERLIDLIDDSEVSQWIEIKSADDIPSHGCDYLIYGYLDSVEKKSFTVLRSGHAFNFRLGLFYMPIPTTPNQEDS